MRDSVSMWTAVLLLLTACGDAQEAADGEGGPPATTRAASQPPAAPREELPDTVREVIEQNAASPTGNR